MLQDAADEAAASQMRLVDDKGQVVAELLQELAFARLKLRRFEARDE